MTLNDIKKNTLARVLAIDNLDKNIELRLMELGLNVGVKVSVINKSLMKKTMLICFGHSCFTLKDNIAKNIKVEYV